MGKNKRRSRSIDEDDKENRLEKRLKRLEEAILSQRGNKRHKKRHRHYRGSSDSSEEGSSLQRGSRRNERRGSRSRERTEQDEIQILPTQGPLAGQQSIRQTEIQTNASQAPSAGQQNVQQTVSQAQSSRSSFAGQQEVNQAMQTLFVGQQEVNQATQTLFAGQQNVHQATQSPVAEVQDVQQAASHSLSLQRSSAADPMGQLNVQQTAQDTLAGQNVSQEIQSVEACMEIPLDPKIVEILGKRFLEERVLGAIIPKDMVIRWDEILKRGLPAEDRLNLITKYPPPSNCLIIDPPRVNPEVLTCLQEAVIKRDERILAKQTKISACLAAIGKTFSNVLDGGGGKLLILEQLSDVGRLLADLQHDESVIRKSLILANLSVTFKDILNATIPDEMLFGKDLEDKIKAAKALETSRKELKPIQKPQVQKFSKNPKAPPRRTQGNQKFSSASSGKKESRTQYSSYRRDSRRNDTRSGQKNDRNSHRKRY